MPFGSIERPGRSNANSAVSGAGASRGFRHDHNAPGVAWRAMTRPGSFSLVTGASSGIGRVLASRLAEEGNHLILVARSQRRLDDLADRLRARFGNEVEVLVADLTIPEQLRQVEARLRRSPFVSTLVNNAGALPSGPFGTVDRDSEDSQIRLLVTATVRLTHAALEGMVPRGQGTIVNVSSNVAFRPHAEFATYGAAKAFMSYFTRSLAQDPRFGAIRFLEVCPPRTRTEIFERAGYSFSAEEMAGWVSPEEVVDETMEALASGKAVSFPGERTRDRVIRRLIPRRFGGRVAGTINRLAGP